MSYECVNNTNSESLNNSNKVIHKRWIFNLKKIKDKLKSFSGPIGLLIALMIYTAVGGLVFQQLELPSELARLEQIRETILTRRNYLINRILNNSDLSSLPNMMKVELHSYELAIQEAAQGGFFMKFIDEIESSDNSKNLTSVLTDRWNILQAVFFASTVLTTIGYGNVVPSTIQGRIFCIFFAFVGIPLTLTVIANWGKLFADVVRNLTVKLHSKLPSFLTFYIPADIIKRRYLGAFAAMIFLFLYLSLGAALFMIWEKDWSFFDGFYFCFVTMTTIGFGDLIPKKPKYMLLCTLYILVGLALTSTIIELIRRQYAESWQQLQVLSGLLGETLKKLSEQAGAKNVCSRSTTSELKKIFTIISLAKLRTATSSKYSDEIITQKQEWEDVEAFFRDFKDNKNLYFGNFKKPILKVIIYESSV
ncbi:hypothetical protein HCN44_000460 [Aphidius gifuensis]|uniref:Potassium channel domain-containing protein n=1 Tax=Aphidius gifuensis TaxID=684658 RepID=A0A834XRX4_APHGI|nr:TWiK family of potassium channels protein 7 [Aphidius gifuensis]KAF7990655.1 hypothetical protein HCN44_000460 [Aphidius gifuensis]